MRTSLLVLAAVLTLGLAASAGSRATAATISFSGLSGSCLGASPSYAEAGITATGSGFGPAYSARPGVLHMDDSGTFCPQSVTFTAARPFAAVSVEILPLSSWYCADPGNCAATDPYDNVLWQGAVGGTVVASSTFFMGTADSTYVFGEAFRGLDSLTVSALRPDIARIGGECFDAPCAHFELDNLILAPVPLPAAAWLFASGIGALAAAGGTFRRSRRPAVRPTP